MLVRTALMAMALSVTLPAVAAAGEESHRFKDPFKYTAEWDSAERDAWQRPGVLADILAIRPGSAVADIGAGTGYFTRFFSWVTEEKGKVYAVDIEPAMLEYIRNRQDFQYDNVETILAEPEDPKLPPDSVDAIVIVNTWHHLPKRPKYLKKLEPALRRGGRVAVVDWREGVLDKGPPPEAKIPRDRVVAEFENAGWTLTSESKALEYQYLLIFKPGK